MNKKNILCLTRSLLPGGTEQEVLLLVRSLNSEIFNITTASLNAHGPIADEIKNTGIPVYDLGFSSFKKVGQNVRIIRQLVKLIKTQEIDMVHAYGYGPTIFASVVCRITGIHFISSQRNLYLWEGRFSRMVLGLFMKNVDLILTNSEATMEAILQELSISKNRIQTIHNLVQEPIREPKLTRQIRTEFGIPKEDIVVGMVANLRPIKNPELFVEIASEICGKFDNVHFISIGEGSIMTNLRRTDIKTDLHSRIHFLGRVVPANPYYDLFDIFLLTSNSESFSMAILEAMSHGLPIIATNVGGVPEAVLHGDNGFLCAPRDKHCLVNFLMKLVHDPELRIKMGKRSKDIVRERFDASNTIGALEEVYLNIDLINH